MLASYRATDISGAQNKMGRPLLGSTGRLPLQSLLRLPPSPQAPILHSQHVVPEAALPLGLVEEIVEVAAEGDEHKAKGQEAKNACGGPGVGRYYQSQVWEQQWGGGCSTHWGLKDS